MNESENRKPSILIVDDEALVRNMLCELLSEKYLCTTAESAAEALSLLKKEKFDLVISDINLGDTNGIELLPRIIEAAPEAVVMMISGNQTIDSPIEAMRVGAFDYIKKPFDLEHIELAVSRALNHHALLAAKRRYENNLEELVRQRTEQLNYLSYHDLVTELPNQSLFDDRFSQALILAGEQSHVGLFLISLDRFKEIQDIIGYPSGKQILQKVAGRLKETVNKRATVARFDGDEFAILLTNIKDIQDVIDITNEINEALKQPIVIGDNEIYLTASIGISIFPNDGEDAQTLLTNANVALSRAEEQGGNNHQFYTSDMNARAVNRLSLENNLRRAIEREEFEVFYQQKMDVSTKNVVGMEALVRWRHPELGFIPPSEFIPLAEDTGLIVPLGEWILQNACDKNKSWHDEGFDLQVSVNLSARQFEQQNLAETIMRITDKTGLNPTCLNLEVTESSVMKNAESSVKTLKKLKESGIGISIDDFGTGYSSLSYLKRLPIDVLKIDRSFVKDVTTNPDDASLVMAIVTLAHNLRLKVVAEGVETEEQLKFLHLLRCDEYQGYLFGKPVSAAEFRKLLDKAKTSVNYN